jgi:asparagine synthase (glutamine-hydrolysing)
VEICRPADLDEMLLRTVRQFGEPFADDSSMATIMLSSAARKHVTVALNGDGGDELACGYTSYTHAKVATRFHRLHPLGAPSEEAVWALFDDPSLAGALRRKLVYSYLRPELKHLMRRVRQFHLYRKRLYKQGSLESVDLRTFLWHLDLAQRSYRFADNPVERLLWIDNIHSLPDMLLVKADIGSMAYGLEVRSPLLDHVLVEKLARIPFSLKIKGGEPKYLLKKLAERYLPKDILYRRKQGFSMPVASWLRGPAVPLAREAFAQAAPFLDRFLARTELEVLLEEHISGKRNHKNILWNLLNLALWAVDRGA